MPENHFEIGSLNASASVVRKIAGRMLHQHLATFVAHNFLKAR